MNQRGIEKTNQTQQMSHEELQKTQVLNLKDVEEAARYEKVTSKKPAIIVAVLGIISILAGTAFPMVQSLTTAKEPEKKTERKVEKKKLLNTESKLNCTLTMLNNPDGTDSILNVLLNFNYDKLTKVTKTYTVNPTVGNSLGQSIINTYTTAYQQFLTSTIVGYQMSVTPINNGVIITSTVNYSLFDPSTLPELHRGNIATSVEYQAGTDKNAINSDIIKKGFTCQ